MEYMLKDGEIRVSHITIRQSISLLVLRLLLLDLISIFLIVVFQYGILTPIIPYHNLLMQFAHILIFAAATLKMALSTFVVLQWVNEYYEISPTELIHRRGIIFVKEDHFTWNHVGEVRLSQSLLGRIFNFGHITLFSPRLINILTEMNYIHNPWKYLNVAKSLVKNVDTEVQTIREHVLLEDKRPFTKPVAV